MNNTSVNLLVGWSAGYTYIEGKIEEDEVKQGKNYYLSSLYIFTQLSQLGVILSNLNKALPPNPLTRFIPVWSNLAPFVTLPISLFCAAVKQGEYENLAKLYKQSRYAYIPVPEDLNGRAASFFSFFAEHTGDMIQVAVIAASIGLIALGQVAYGGAALAAVTYATIDKMGLIPRRISLFMEIYMPTVSLIGMCIGGTLLVRTISAISLSTHILPPLTRFLHQRVDAFVRLFFNIGGPTLKDIDAPLVRKDEMTFEEIENILNSDLADYKVNPAHCAQSTINLNEFPVDHDFEKFLPLFDSINWESKYTVVKSKLKDDERFISFLLEKFPDSSKEDLQEDIHNYIDQLAFKDGLTPEKYAANWVREQMVQLIKVLKGDVRVKGHQQDLDESIEMCAILLPYLSSLKNQVELEDALLKLAVEGGDYCARGIKGASNELLSGVLQGGIRSGEKIDDPIKDFELQVLQALQNRRSSLIQNAYQAITQGLHIPHGVAKDKHGFDIYRFFLSLGCFPMTKFERNRVAIPQILLWEFYGAYRKGFYHQYKHELEGVVNAKELLFSKYLEGILNQNKLLSEDQRKELFAKYASNNNWEWTPEKTWERFHRILLVKLGVLIPA